MTSFDVRVFAIRRRPGRKVFEVRWRVAGRDRSRSFMTRALADSYRSELVRAARRGLAFDPANGEPAAWAASEPVTATWYQHAVAYSEMKWPRLAPHSRASLADALATVTPLLTRETGRRPPDRTLRAALYGHAFNPSRRSRNPVTASAPAWLARASLPVSQLSDPHIIRAALDGLCTRLDGSPLNSGDVDTMRQRLESEAQAARELAGRTRFPTPKPVTLGEPGPRHPFPWSVLTWLPGSTATVEDPGDSVAFAHDLAEFISGVRAIGTHGKAFSGQGRGGDLRRHDGWMQTCFERSEQVLDVPLLRRIWGVLRVLPRNTGDVMTHGDLIPGNVLTSSGRLTGIIDVGGLGPADPALDLVSAWHLLEAGPRRVLRDDLKCDDLDWERGKAWACATHCSDAPGSARRGGLTRSAPELTGATALRRIEVWSLRGRPRT